MDDRFRTLLYFSLLLFLPLVLPLTSKPGSSTAGAPGSTSILDLPPSLLFDDAYTQVFGDGNLMVAKDGRAVHISLDKRTGAGFASQELYMHGFFSASIKLPPNYAAGVVVALYMSNGDVFEANHDELDFEFLGNVRGKEWRVQTNVYGNGSRGVGREERYGLWFDPTEEFHQYSILWTRHRIVFYIDNVAIREILRTTTNAIVTPFPSKPMSLYATIWDGSNWATSGGRYKVNYKYAPFVADFSNLILHGCAVNPMDHSSLACDESGTSDDPWRGYDDGLAMPSDQRTAMEAFRERYMTYSYCYDRDRYLADLPPECPPKDATAAQELSGRRRFGSHHRTGGDRKRRRPPSIASGGSRNRARAQA